MASSKKLGLGDLDIITSAPNSAIATHNQTLCSSPELIFLSCEPICEIQENLYLGKMTRYMISLNLVTNISYTVSYVALEKLVIL